MSVNEKMTALADEVRELSGTTTPKSIDAMTSDVDAANTEIAEQVGLIAQIANALEGKAAGTTLPALNNPASASDILSGKEAVDGSGNKITGTIATKTSSNLSASGATVTVPAGYYASQATKSVTTATRADTTISVTADDTNDKLTITAANNQGTGYVTGANKTATKTITLTTSGATVTASDGSKSISKSVATATQATPSVSIDANGKITASATQTAGYVSAGTKSGTKQLTTQAAKTITPSTSSQTAVAKNVYTTGAVTVAAIPSTYKNTSDATVSADEVFAGETAYTTSGKITGTFTIEDELTEQNALISQISNLVATKATPSGEEVTAETNAYTAKIASLETAITALETELEGKASGGSGGNSFVQVTNSPSSYMDFYYVNSDYQFISAIPGKTVNALGGIIWTSYGLSLSCTEGTANQIASVGGYDIYAITSDSAYVVLMGSGGSGN